MDRPTDRNEHLPLVLIPGAGGFYARTDGVVEACKAHGDTVLLDYPELQWHYRRTDLAELAAEMHARLRARMGQQPFVLAGESLGAIIAALIAHRDRHELRVVRLIAIDPVRAPTSQIQAGWVARNLGRARRAGGTGLPAFIWVRINRTVARFLAPRLRRKSRAAMLAAQVLAGLSPAVFGRQLRMRLLIDHAAVWQPEQGVAASDVPCKVLHTESKIPDATFWKPRFQSIDFIGIQGDHDTWIQFDGPRLLLEQWDAARAPAQSGQTISAL